MAASLVRPVDVAAPTSAGLDKGKGKSRALTLGQDLGAVDAAALEGGWNDKWGKAPVPQLSKKERKSVRRHDSHCGILNHLLMRAPTEATRHSWTQVVQYACTGHDT